MRKAYGMSLVVMMFSWPVAFAQSAPDSSMRDSITRAVERQHQMDKRSGRIDSVRRVNSEPMGAPQNAVPQTVVPQTAVPRQASADAKRDGVQGIRRKMREKRRKETHFQQGGSSH